MNTCSSLSESLTRYLLDELSEDRRSELETHLQECAQCQAKREQLESTVALLQESGPETPRLSLSSRSKILAAIPWGKPSKSAPAISSPSPRA